MKIAKDLLRDVPNWPQAPVPLCMGGDYRALTFCCKPGHSLSHGVVCLRDKVLDELGITTTDFMHIKEEFSKTHTWKGNFCCFGSLSYCCMRRNGCDRRDTDLQFRYPKLSTDEMLAEYFKLKRELAKIILDGVKNRIKVNDLYELL